MKPTFPEHITARVASLTNCEMWSGLGRYLWSLLTGSSSQYQSAIKCVPPWENVQRISLPKAVIPHFAGRVVEFGCVPLLGNHV